MSGSDASITESGGNIIDDETSSNYQEQSFGTTGIADEPIAGRHTSRNDDEANSPIPTERDLPAIRRSRRAQTGRPGPDLDTLVQLREEVRHQKERKREWKREAKRLRRHFQRFAEEAQYQNVIVKVIILRR
ncbi:hypothetical protein CAC42_5934 [Sphaceloma murrayae]|uniref:Uncharacterized protein n=1 Tax=Sphaceloma murrayae TaxID=2082308 RepID=A0A2K1QZL1_9PEZI|nr:hypothetical protein CAC42_5934 [Sphaceloma murrayae]